MHTSLQYFVKHLTKQYKNHGSIFFTILEIINWSCTDNLVFNLLVSLYFKHNYTLNEIVTQSAKRDLIAFSHCEAGLLMFSTYHLDTTPHLTQTSQYQFSTEIPHVNYMICASNYLQ